MEIRDDGVTSRAERILAWLRGQTTALATLEQRLAVQLYRFDGTPTETTLAALTRAPNTTPPTTAAPANGTAPIVSPTVAPATTRGDTDLARALALAQRDALARPLGGVVIATDAIDHHGFTVNSAGKLADDHLRTLRALDAPVYIIDPTANLSITDVAIARVIADDFAFVRNSIEVAVDVTSAGYSGPVAVTLTREGEIVETLSATIAPDAPAKLTFRFSPDRVGKFIYTARVAPVSGDAVLENNEQSFVLRVIRDKMRVLHVAGTPTWDLRFLRSALKRNPGIDLISFFILRTRDDPTFLTDQKELALIPFPTEELFTTQLRTFDVVIFQNFDFGPYDMARYLPNVRDFVVNDGGGFVMLGGDRSFGSGGYSGTPIADLLPFDLTTKAAATDPFRPILTPQGQRHPIFRAAASSTLLSDPETLAARAASLVGYNLVGAPKPGSAVLVAASSSASPSAASPSTIASPAASNGPPIVAIREAGRGRVLAITTDSLWRWPMGDATHEPEPALYDRFWRNALRWLVHDPDTNPIEMRVEPESAAPGEPVRVRVRALGKGYAPAAGALIRLEAGLADGADEAIAREAETGPSGEGVIELSFDRAGAYRLKTEVLHEGASLGSEEAVVLIRAQDAERTDVAVRRDTMRAIAEATGGAVLSPEDADLASLELRDAGVERVEKREHRPLWNTIYLLVALLAFAATEWALRRYWGLI